MALDITSYEIGKKAGGGITPTGTINITENGTTNVTNYATANVNVQPNLETKSITITENKTTTITPTSGKDGLSSVEVTTNVSGGDDWSDIGYSSTPESIEEIHAYSKQIYDNWDVDNPHKFQSDTKLIICPSIDTSKMTNMSNMFRGCNKLKEIKGLDTSNVTTMETMFNESGPLTYADFSSFDTSKVTSMKMMFRYNLTGLKTLNLSSFDTSNVTDMFMMFALSSSITTINFGNNFKLTSVTNVQNMFQNCNNLDDNTLNQILHICTTIGSSYTGTKTLATLGITSSFTNYANIPNLSNYQAFLDAGWTIS